MTITLLQGDCREVLATLPEKSIQTVITSPPYLGLRRYTSDPREIGQERAPDCLAWARREPPCGPGACYVCALRAVFAAVWRVLRDDGTAWVNLGDSYNTAGGVDNHGKHATLGATRRNAVLGNVPGLREKNLLLIPARVALALQSDGWIVRSDVIWSKPNCMPESVTDRPTRAHEYVYLLSKQARYYYDADAIREDAAPWNSAKGFSKNGQAARNIEGRIGNRDDKEQSGRNKRSVWTISTRPFKGSHFAVMPEALIEPCLLAGSSAQACEHCGAAWGRVVEREKPPQYDGGKAAQLRASGAANHRTASGPSGNGMGVQPTRDLGFAPRCACPGNTGAASSTVLDPFAGTFTVGRVAERFGRNAIGIELNPDYTELSDARTNGVQKELFV